MHSNICIAYDSASHLMNIIGSENYIMNHTYENLTWTSYDNLHVLIDYYSFHIT